MVFAVKVSDFFLNTFKIMSDTAAVRIRVVNPVSDSELFAVERVRNASSVFVPAFEAYSCPFTSTLHTPIGIARLSEPGLYQVPFVGVDCVLSEVSVSVCVHTAGSSGNPDGALAVEYEKAEIAVVPDATKL